MGDSGSAHTVTRRMSLGQRSAFHLGRPSRRFSFSQKVHKILRSMKVRHCKTHRRVWLGSSKPCTGKTKLKELTQFFDSVLDGSAELKPVRAKSETEGESVEPPKDEL